jgi:hypothetical protein
VLVDLFFFSGASDHRSLSFNLKPVAVAVAAMRKGELLPALGTAKERWR